MTRGLEPELEASVDSNGTRLLTFLKMELDSGTQYLHDGVGVYTWDGQTWSGLGDFGSVSTVEEGDMLAPYDVTLMLSGLDSSLLNEALNENISNRDVTLYIGGLNVVTGQLLNDPNEVWSGTMDVPSITAGEENTISITCESEFADFDRPNNSVFSDADLQAEYPGDLYFRELALMVDTIIVWKGAATVGTVGAPGRPHIDETFQR